MENGRGFTLAELLVVVSVVAVGGALLFAGLGIAGENEGIAECTDNFKKLGQTVQIYAQDYGGWVPVSGGYRGDGMWQMQETFVRQGYLRDMDRWVCPSISPYSYKNYAPAQTYAPIRFRESVHARAVILPAHMKYALELARDPETDKWNPGAPGRSYLSLERVREPSDYFVIVERSHEAGFQHAMWGREHTSIRLHMRHGDVTNMLFADGSVDAVDIQRVEELGFESAWTHGFELVEFGE